MKFDMYGLEWPELCDLGFTNKVNVTDGNYFYEAFARPGVALADKEWCVRRTHTTSGNIEWAQDSNAQEFAATDLPALFA